MGGHRPFCPSRPPWDEQRQDGGADARDSSWARSGGGSPYGFQDCPAYRPGPGRAGPDDPRVLAAIGLRLARRGDADGARQWLTRAARTDDPEVLCTVAGVHHQVLGDPGAARPLYERAARYGSTDAMRTLGALLTDQEPWPSADAGRRPREAASVTVDPGDPLTSADGLRLAYVRTGDPPLLELALDMCRLAVQTYRGSARTDRYALALSTLGVLLRMAYERERSPGLLAEAVETGRAAVAASSRKDPEYARHLSGLAGSLQEVFERSGDLAVIDEAIALYRTCLSVVPPSHPEHAGLRTDFGSCLLRRACQDPDPALLDEAVQAGRSAVRGTPPDHPRYPTALSNLAAALVQYALVTVQLPALDEAVDAYERALEAFPAGHPSRERAREALATCARVRQAMHAGRGTTQRPRATRHGASAGAAAVLREASARLAGYERNRALPDLEAAVTGFESVLRSSADAGLRAAAADGLGTATRSRYERGGERRDLDRAVDLFADALAMSPPDDPETPAVRARLSGVLRLRWRLTGDGEDLTAAVELSRAALAAAAPEDPRRPELLSGLAGGLLGIFLHHRDASALAEAVRVCREALAAAPDDAGARSRLAEVLRQLAGLEGTGAAEALDEAVALARAALDATPAGRPLYARFQCRLGITLHQRFTARADPEDLRAAADAARRAVAATPVGDPDRPERLSVLAQVRRLDHERRQDAEALGALIDDARAAAEAAPPGHRLRAQALTLYAHALGLRAAAGPDAGARAAAEARGAAEARMAAEAVHRELAHDATAAVSARVRAARRWAYSALSARDLAGALEPFALAVELLPRTAPRRGGRSTDERPPEGFAGLASDAAACAIGLGAPERALRLLEQGRRVLLGQALDLGPEPPELRAEHPGLTHRLEELREALDRPEESVFGSSASVAGCTGAAALALGGEDRHALAEEWERLTARIRQQPGFEGFLRPPEVPELLAALDGRGRAVVVNVSGLRCDALVLTRRSVRVVPLPALSREEAVRRADAFFPAVRTAEDAGAAEEERARARARVRETLEWLWTAVAGPVLGALGLTGRRSRGTKDGALPRLWWVPTGPLTGLPLHAAGRHDASGRPADSVLDRVVSSYAPTVHALARAVRRGADGPPGPEEPLVVAVPATAEAPGPPGGREGIAALTRRLPAGRVLTGERARRDVVLDTLPRHRWAHFACRAVSELGAPSAGRMLLHDHRERPLTAADLARLPLDDARLAYLPGCVTTRTRREPGAEPVHLTAAFHLAGYAHVLGTLWSPEDTAAERIADACYTQVTATGTAGAARALHDAVRTLRDAHPEAPTRWAAFVHVGA
ncbi:CHAT domain-containing tetratricopeptide repeat protein [Streptomyces coffeae]|uniref:CHAT domain-containing protein n=1 Tax=Streptomyces coffeae TaxID=621382 RepID=A0ABS1NMJ4_9ACTN|nr:CHAT domain-containing protein [Streptomyces coffeae]MBL1101281.1 CHAT domain-containing protein [Streptomyces coffeae]